MIIEKITDETTTMEPQHGSAGLRSGSIYVPPTFLGFFLQPLDFLLQPLGTPISRMMMDSPKRAPQFMCASREGKELLKGRWGIKLDASLRFLGKEVDIVASSNGFLLCRANPEVNWENFFTRDHNMDYIICNPVTREFQSLPRPHKPHLDASIAFICKGHDEVHYEIIRAGAPKPRQLHTCLEIETFSSDTNTWIQTVVVSDSPFYYGGGGALPTGIVIDDVIFWNVLSSSRHRSLLAYDRRQVGLPAKVILPPPGQDGQKFVCRSDHYGLSQGKLRYARMDYSSVLEIWALDDCRTADWKLKRRVHTNQMRGGLSGEEQILGIHPQNSQLVFVTVCVTAFWFDVQSMQRREITRGHWPFSSRYFLYEWPL